MKLLDPTRTLLVAALLSAPIAPVAAFSIDSTTRTAFTQYLNSPDLAQDSDAETHPGPPGASSISARVEARLDQLSDPLAPSAPGYMRAAAGPSGFSEALVAGRMTGSGFSTQSLNAVVSESLTATAASTHPGSYEVVYSFDLFDMFFEFWDDFGLSGHGTEYLSADFDYTVRLGSGGRIHHFTAIAEAWDGLNGFRVFSGPELSPLSSWTASVDPVDGHLRIDFSPISVSDLVLGTLELDAFVAETFTVETELSARLVLPDCCLDVGGRVGISDPNGLTVNAPARLRLSPVSPAIDLALPGTVWLLALGLVPLGHRARRRRP